MLPRTPAPRRRSAPADGASRFSPLNAPQRAIVDAFCEQSRPWALRQAARTYRHLPEELREQAVDQAMRELQTGAPAAVDRRTLHAELADELTEALRRVHVGWCLNQSAPLWHETAGAAPPAPPVEARKTLAGFIEEGLGGLERAVLQLEIGAGRDTRTVRAALRLGPRQYARHREQGLSKLRDAIVGSVNGQVCDHHLHDVVLAATGDRAAADALAGGAGRCRSCSREAQGLRRLLHERLALAPWPFVIKPASVIATKLAAIGAIGKSAGGGGGGILAGVGAGSGGSAAVPTVLAVAALATGGGALLGGGDATDDRVQRMAPAAAAVDEPGAKRSSSRDSAVKRRFAAAKDALAEQERQARRRHTGGTPASSGGSDGSAQAPARSRTPSAPPQTSTAATPVTAPTGPAGTAIQKVDDTADTVGRVTKPVVPPQVAQPVDQTLDAVQDTVKQVGGTVDSLLQPK